MEIMDLYTAALIRLASMLQCTNYVAMGSNPDQERKNERIYVDNYWKDQDLLYNYESNLTTGEEIEIGEEKELSIVVDANRSETVLLNYCTVHACVVVHSSVNVWSFGV
jgi:hypothetical protein